MKLQNTIQQQQSLKKEYDAVKVCINLVQHTWATRSAFAYERRAFAYVIIFIFDRILPITCMRHNSDLAKE